MNRLAQEKITQLLDSCNVMSIATYANNCPWASSVFFVADESYSLYFVSADSSRHSQNISANSKVAATVKKDHNDWLRIRGLQIEGRVSISPDRERLLLLYRNKFPRLAQLIDHAASDQEKLIRDRLKSSNFYQLKPVNIRLIDNSVGFGSRMEMMFPS